MINKSDKIVKSSLRNITDPKYLNVLASSNGDDAYLLILVIKDKR